MSKLTTTVTFALASGCMAILYIGQRALRGRSQAPYPLPPGPPGLPWFGNIIGIDTSAPWLTYAAWSNTYGDIIYSRLFGKDVIIINSEKIAKELLDNRSKNYSDRPFLPVNELLGLDFNTVTMPYGDRWRLQRRFLHRTFQPKEASRFLPYQHRKACHLLRQLLDAPEELDNHVFQYAASVILNCAYDYDPASRKDELVDTVANLLTVILSALRLDLALIPGIFPFLLYLPSWFPGMSFKRKLEMARGSRKRYLDQPFDQSLRKMQIDGSTTPSVVHDALQDSKEKDISPDASWMQSLKESAATASVAASETSSSFLMTFFVAMMLNPAAQEKAQAQIDEVVGNTRLPTIDDRPSLPFVDAVLRETIRYNPVVPMLTHAAVEEDVYNGFRIPKGAVISPNIWAMAHDESKYPNSHAFIPERFLNDDGSLKPNDTTHLAYGFGRRICVGSHFADASVWTVIAKVLAVFKILRPLDENGVEITVEPKFTSGIVIHPLPFGYRIVPRFPGMNAEKLEELIAASS